MAGKGGDRKIAARELVLALHAGLDAGEAMLEGEIGVPYFFGQVGAGQPFHLDAGAERLASFPPDGFALARRQRLQKRLERRVAGILPMELLIGALEEALGAQEFRLRLRQKGDM